MSDDQRLSGPSPDDAPRPGGPARVWDLIRTYGPDVATLCRAGTALLPGIDGLGLSAAQPGPPAPPVVRFASDRAGGRLESAQHTWDEGPCRDAATTRRPVQAVDLTSAAWTARWPRFTPAALEAGVHAVLALPLQAGGIRHDGAVDLYRRRPGGFAAHYPTVIAFCAAVTELLALEGSGRDWTGAFAAARRDHTILDVAGGAVTAGTGATLAADAATDLPLAGWFDRTTQPTLRRQIHTIISRRETRRDAAHRYVLAVHEAMTNAVQHGGGHGQLLLWQRDDRLWCEISDHGPGIPDTARPDNRSGPVRTGAEPSEIHGLRLIQQACTSTDITTDSTGTRLLLSHRLDYLNGGASEDDRHGTPG